MRVLSLNLWNVNEPLDERHSVVERLLISARPEIVALQEVSPLAGEPQCNDLARRCGYDVVYALSGIWKGREEGLAILTRSGTLTWRATASLPEADNDMQRILLHCEYRHHPSGVTFTICNTHLAFAVSQWRERAAQAQAIAESLRAIPPMHPLILCGDLNEVPAGHAVQTLLNIPNVPLVDPWEMLELPSDERSHTFAWSNPWAAPALTPGRRIDYVLLSPRLRVVSVRLAFTGIGGDPRASDHYGVLVEFECNHEDAAYRDDSVRNR